MTPERCRQIKDVFDRLYDLEGEDRARALAEECKDDLELRKEIESLLWSHDASGQLPFPSIERLAHEAFRTTAQTSASPAPSGAKGVAADDSRALKKGQILDETYRIDELVGQGGMGAVYRATHLLFDATVAVKVLLRQFSDDREWLDRFKQEGKALRAFSHPNAVAVWDLRIRADGTAFLVMDFVAGETLRDLIRRKRTFPLHEVQEVVEQVASVLDAAHARGVIHRDLKPENVLASVDSGERISIKVVDFGIAKLENDSAADKLVTQTGAIIGTLLYMAPERLGDKSRDRKPAIDRRVDVYALGLLAYELLTGEPAVEGESLFEIRDAHLEIGDLVSTGRRGNLDRDLARVVGRALARDRNDRPSTAGEFAATFREAVFKAQSAIVPERLPAALDLDTAPSFQLMAQLVVESHFGAGTIEVYWGDLTKPPPGFFFDTLVVSAYPGDYSPTEMSLVGGLAGCGISVEALATIPWVDLRSVANCWLSRELTPEETSLPIGRILCFEPPDDKPPGDHVGDIFRSLVAAFSDVASAQTVAMPLVATGDRSTPAQEMIQPLVEASVEWMRRGLPLRRLLIVTRDREKAVGLAKYVSGMKRPTEAHLDWQPPRHTGADVFVSHAFDDRAIAMRVAEQITAFRPDTKVKLGDTSEARASGWGDERFDDVDTSTIVVPLISSSYVTRSACLEEYNAALYRHRASTDGVLYPLLVADANIPSYVATFGVMDCRDPTKIEVAARRLAAILDAREKM